MDEFKQGDRVQVSYPVGQEDRSWQGRYGTFVEYTKPNGYARVVLDGEEHISKVLLHPESLNRCEYGMCGFVECQKAAMPHIHTQACYGPEIGKMICES